MCALNNRRKKRGDYAHFALKFIAVLCFLSFASEHSAQSDSLRNYIDSLDAQPQDTHVLKARWTLSFENFYADAELARTQGRKALDMAKDLNEPWYKAEMCIMLAWAYIETADWDSCKYFTERLIEYGPTSGRTGMKGEAYRIQAVMYSQQGNYGKSIELNQLALQDAIENEQLDKQAATLNNIAMQFYFQEDTTTALQFFNRSKDTYLQIDEEDVYIANVLKNMSTLESDEVRQRQLIDSAITIYKNNNDWDLVGSAYTNISDEFYARKHADSCMHYAKKAWELLKSATTTDRYDAYRSMSNALALKGRNEAALSYLDTAILGHASSALPDQENAMYRKKAKLLSKLGRHAEANKAWQKSITLTDSLSKASNKEYSQKFNTIFETKKKEEALAKEIEKSESERNKRKSTIWISLGVLAILSSIFYSFYRGQRRKRDLAEKETLLVQQEKDAVTELINMRSQFFTNISHELKTPLTLVSGPLEELKDHDWNNKEIAFKVDLARRNSSRLLDMVNEILQLSKLESGHIELHPRPLDINAYFRRSFNAFHSLAETREVQLEYSSNIENVVVEADEENLQRIISNLISNAIKYTRDQSTVTMQVFGKQENEDLQLTIDIQDQGLGIPSDHIERIFGRFYQSATTKGREMGGVGIGLSLAKQLTELMSGQLELAHSNNEGSTFRVSLNLPISDQTLELSEEAGYTYVPNLTDLKDMTILIVEDNPDMGEYLQSILTNTFNILWAKDGYEALRLLQTTARIDLVTSDIMMPKMNGYQLRKQILSMPEYRTIPFLFLTARSLDEDVMHGFNLGADDYITKPFKSKELLARIENLLNNSKERKRVAIESGEQEDTDLSILEKFESYVRRNIGDSQLKLGDIGDALNISERQLRRKVKADTGMTPIELILEIRLLKARHLLEKKHLGTVAEIMYQVGIESASYFSRKFTQRFGRPPSTYLTH